MSPRAIITGAAKRIGRYIALDLAAKGYDIVLHYNHSESEATATADEIRQFGQEVRLIQADLSKTTDFSAFFDAPASLLIHNASVFYPHRFLDTTPTQFDENMAIHLRAAFFLSQAFAKHTTKGLIISMLDVRINAPDPATFAYSLSKNSLADFTTLLATELSPGIRVNGICPGHILAASHLGQVDEDGAVRCQPVCDLVRGFIDSSETGIFKEC